MSCLEPLQPAGQLTPLWREFLRTQLLLVRWPEMQPELQFSTVYGMTLGLRMAGVIDCDTQQRFYALLCNARRYRHAEEAAQKVMNQT